MGSPCNHAFLSPTANDEFFLGRAWLILDRVLLNRMCRGRQANVSRFNHLLLESIRPSGIISLFTYELADAFPARAAVGLAGKQYKIIGSFPSVVMNKPDQRKTPVKTKTPDVSGEALALGAFRLGVRDELLNLLKRHVALLADSLTKRWKAMRDETEASPESPARPGTLKIHHGFYRVAVAKFKTGTYGFEEGLTRQEDTAILWEKVKANIDRFQTDIEATLRVSTPLEPELTVKEAISRRLDAAKAVIKTMEESLAELDRDIDRCREATAGEVLNQPDP